ncbi:MAG TPA: DUF3617 family protein [Stellaceae bacterium]|nr:DUF3617 family protein [Xanthobacteraceae bacterium]HUK08760.1 DUF3617 family protein [Stellaceae bacterium]
MSEPKIRKAVWLCGLFAAQMLPLTSSAPAAISPQPGLWRITSSIERAGTTKPGPTQTTCLTADRIKTMLSTSARPNNQARTCKDTEVKTTKAGVTRHVECPSDYTFDTVTNYVVDSPQHYRGSIKMTIAYKSNPVSSTVTLVEGRRIGECKK